MDPSADCRLFVIDDEDLSRQSIAELVDWGAHGFTVVGLFDNGRSAWESLDQLRPQIIITDIRMPEMDGLELIERVHDYDPEIGFIVLSGYSEFDYAIRAMRQGVRHYLLKPCNEDVILKTACDLRDELGLGAGALSLDPVVVGQENEIVASLKDWALKHLSDRELSLRGIATRVLYMNPDYLGRLFSRLTGEKFSDYLRRTRIEKAMDLLRANPALSVFELSTLVGHAEDGHYFYRSFKRCSGMTLMEFRRSLGFNS